MRGLARDIGRRPSDVFFRRWILANRMPRYRATLANYFERDFGDRTDLPAIDIVPRAKRFEFAPGDRVVVLIRVSSSSTIAMLHGGSSGSRQAAAAGDPGPQPAPPSIKFADQPDTPNFWGLRVETSSKHFEMFPPGDGYAMPTGHQQPPAAAHQVFDLSPSLPYPREIDLGRILADVTRPGEYRVQILYDSSKYADRDKGEWDGFLTSPVFTVVIRG